MIHINTIKANNTLKKHKWIKTGKKNELKCYQCGIIKITSIVVTFYLNGENIFNPGCK